MKNFRSDCLFVFAIVLLVFGAAAKEVLIVEDRAWWFAVASCVVACASVAFASGFWSIASVFVVTCSLFHFGLAPSRLFGITPDLFGAPVDWLYSSSADRAVLYSSLCLLMFSVGVSIGSNFNKNGVVDAESHAEDAGTPYAVAGMILVVLGVASWILLVSSNLGPLFFLSSYNQYQAATANGPFSYIFFAIGLGAVFVGAAGTRSRASRVAVGAFIMFGFMALPIGLRGEVLFPLAAFSAMLALRGVRLPSAKLVGVLAVVLLALIGGIKEVRQSGLQDSLPTVSSFSPANGLAELGYTLRTVAAVDSWHATGTPARDGVTYLAPVERAMARIGLAEEQPPTVVDRRLMNVEMRLREGNIGGSVIAESYRNFEGWGALLFLLLGALASLLGRSITVRSQLLAGVYLLLLLQQVRNSFTPIPLQAVVAVSVVLVVCATAETTSTSARTPSNRNRGRGLKSGVQAGRPAAL